MGFEKLMQPLTINGMTLKNRVMMTPMGTNLANPDGSISEAHKQYYRQRAKGGTGLIVVENVCVDFPMGSNGTTQLRLDHDSFIPHLYELTEDLHRYGTKGAIQINHAGGAARSSRIGAQPASASDIPPKTGGEKPRPFTREEILHLVKCFGDSAKRAQMAGFDAVEIHAGHSYLLHQFISPTTNNRTDEFGGTQENRVRFLKMVLEETRNQVGPHFPIMVRISAEEFVPGGLTLEDTLNWLPLIDKYVDLYDVSSGVNDSMEKMIDKGYLQDGWRSYIAAAVRERMQKPVISAGNYRDPAVAEAVLENQEADIIGIGRGLIADPEWCNKVQAGKVDEIRKCISCCIGCAGNRMTFNRPIRCTINPSVVEGDAYKNKRVNKKVNVVVIGGGTSGIEAACTAAEVGCQVTLIEKENHLGGRAALISNLPEKFRMKYFVEYLCNRVSKLDRVKVLLNTQASKEIVSGLKPDLIVCATGSKIITPAIPGLMENLASGNILTADGVINRILENTAPDSFVGRQVAVVGGGATGLDIVEYYANRGAQCTVIEMTSEIGRDLDLISKVSTGNLLREKNVCQMKDTTLKEVRKDSFVTDKGIIPFDIGVICLGLKSYNPLMNEMQDITETISVGDALYAPRQIIDGMREGRNILSTLEEKGYFN